MRRAVVIACSHRKRPAPGGWGPAVQVYDGPAWRTLRAWSRPRVALPHRLIDVYALSALYGFIEADQAISSDYDCRLTPARLEDLVSGGSARVACHRAFGGDSPVDVLLFGGAIYADLLDRLMPCDLEYRRAGEGGLRGAGIGRQLAELRAWLCSVSYV